MKSNNFNNIVFQSVAKQTFLINSGEIRKIPRERWAAVPNSASLVISRQKLPSPAGSADSWCSSKSQERAARGKDSGYQHAAVSTVHIYHTVQTVYRAGYAR